MSMVSAQRPEETLIAIQHERYVDRSKSSWGHCGAVVDLTPLKTETCTGFFINNTWLAGDCLLIERALDGSSFEHTQKHIGDSGELIFINRYVSGFSVGDSQGDPFSIHSGAIAISDYSRPFKGIQTAGVMQGVLLTRQTIDFDPGQNPRLRLFSEHSLVGQFIHAAFDRIFPRLKSEPTALPALQIEQFKDVMRAAVRGEHAEKDIRARARTALKTVVCDFIERKLTDPKLSTSMLLKRFGVSRATLFRMFEMDGGVRHYITYRRLYRAVFQISTNPHTRGQISQAASQWGFSSDANFNRAVRRAFGTKPSALFGAPIQEIKLPPDTRSVWISHRDRLLQSGYAHYVARTYA